jgi:hypothetical protein
VKLRWPSLGCAILVASVWLAGCAFDVIHVNQETAQYDPAASPGPLLTLQDDVKVSIGDFGSATTLKKGTTWRKVGEIAAGEVLATHDQVITVEASNAYEAEPVVAHGEVVGFFLVVEHTFTPADPPVPIAFASKG